MARSHPDLNRIFLGVFAADELGSDRANDKNRALPYALIVNSHPLNHPGQHWHAIFVQEGGGVDFFDSYGIFPPKNVLKYAGRFCPPINFSSWSIQSPIATSCGSYCLQFLLARARGQSMNQFVKKEYSNYSWISNEKRLAKRMRQRFSPYMRPSSRFTSSFI